MSGDSQRTETVFGVFVIVDVVGFTPQSVQRGGEQEQKFKAHIERELGERARAHDYTLFKTLGDAVLLFRSHREGENAAAALIELFLHVLNDVPQLDAFGFKFRFRMVAHSGAFTLTYGANRQPADISGAEGIQTFRSEKLATEGQLLLTQHVYSGCQEDARLRQLDVEPVHLKKPLKGLELFGHSLIYYRLRPPSSEVDADLLLPSLYRDARERLRDSVQFIPVFGQIYDPIPMRENFVELRLDPVKRRPGAYREPFDTEDFSRRASIRRESETSEEANRRITTAQLFEHYAQGIIYGLPGAGKTTILRYLAFRILDAASHTRILLVPCGELTDEHLSCLPDQPRQPPSARDALRACLAIFLYPGEAAQRLDTSELDSLTDQFYAAWRTGNVVVLIDALDEARSPQLRQRLVAWIKALFHTFQHERLDEPGAEAANRCFATARIQFSLELDLDSHPVFEVEPLELGDLQSLARRIFDVRHRQDLADRFVAEIPYQPGAIALGGTPITALLLLFFFEAEEKWASRYETYDVVLKFILLRVWDNAKRIPNQRAFVTLREFFTAAQAETFAINFPEQAALLDAFSSLAWGYLYAGKQVVRVLTENDLVREFAGWLRRDAVPLSMRDVDPAVRARQWFRLLRQEHLFVAAARDRFLFIHSTVLEFLAARALRASGLTQELVGESHRSIDRLALETLPMLCGSDWEVGHRLLELIEALFCENTFGRTLPLRCLAETELAETRALERTLYPPARADLLRRIDEASPKDWVYRSLSERLAYSVARELKAFTEEYHRSVPLSREVFPERYLHRERRWDQSGGSAEIQARQALLRAVLRKDLYEQYVEEQPGWHDVEDRPLPSILQLDRARDPDDKNFSYYLTLARRGLRRGKMTLQGFYGSPHFRHEDAVLGVAVAPDGLRSASASNDGTVRVWELNTGRELLVMRGHVDGVTCVAWSPDGAQLLSGSNDATLKLWEVATGRELRVFSGHERSVRTCAFSPNGSSILSGSDDCTLKLWDAATGRELRSFPRHKGAVIACALNSDGRFVLSGAANDRLKLRETETQSKPRAFAGLGADVKTCVFSPDSRFVLSGLADGTLKLWKTDTRRDPRAFVGHVGEINTCAFSPDGHFVLSGSDDHTLKLWEPETAAEQKARAVRKRKSQAMPSQKLFGRELHAFVGHTDNVNACAFSPDGRLMLSGSSDATLKLWESKTGRELLPFQRHKSTVNACAFSADGRWLLSGSGDRTLRLWDAASGREIRAFAGHKGSITACAFSPNGKHVLSGSNDTTLKLWDVRTGLEARVFAGHERPVWTGAFSPDGQQVLSGADDDTLRLWDVTTGREVCNFVGHACGVSACAFSPDGRHVLSGCRDRTLKLWNTATKREVRTFSGHEGSVWACAISPNGLFVLSGSDDETLKVWDAASGYELATLSPQSGEIAQCYWSANSAFFYAVSRNGTLMVWDSGTYALKLHQETPFGALNFAVNQREPGLIAIAHTTGVLTLWRWEARR